MNLPLFIARRIAKNASGSFSSTIHRIAVFSITISLSALIISFFVLYGFKDTIRSKVYNLSGHLTVNKYAVSTSFEDTFISISDSLREGLKHHEEIQFIHEYILKAGLLKTDEGVQGVIIKGVEPEFGEQGFEAQMIEGEFPDFSRGKYSTEVAISDYMAKLLRIKAGDKLTLFFVQDPPRYRRITITGIYTTGMEEFDEKIVIGDIRMLRLINDWETDLASGIEVILKDYQKMDRMEDELFDELPVDLNVVSANRQYPQIFEWLELLNRNVLILLIVIIVVAALGMISMILILIMERTRMIGAMKAMGAENKQIQKVFIYSGLSLVLRGLFFGNGIGLALCWLQWQFHFIPLDVTNYYMHFVPITFDIPTLFGLNLLMILLISLTLFIPVRIVSSIKPIESIRFD